MPDLQFKISGLHRISKTTNFESKNFLSKIVMKSDTSVHLIVLEITMTSWKQKLID